MGCKLTSNITKESCNYDVAGVKAVYLYNYDSGNTYTPANSTGCPARSSGVFCPNLGSFSCCWPPLTCSAVHTGPGATEFTRIPFEAICFANPRVKAIMALLVAA